MINIKNCLQISVQKPRSISKWNEALDGENSRKPIEQKDNQMANNYVQFAAYFKFPQQAAEDMEAAAQILNDALESGKIESDDVKKIAWFFDVLDTEDDIVGELLENNDKCESILNDYGIFPFELNFDYDKGSGCLHIGSYQADIDIVTALLQATMKHHDIDGVIGFEAAMFCDCLRPDEFGGIACAVSKDSNLTEGTGSLRRKLIEELENDQKQTQGPH